MPKYSETEPGDDLAAAPPPEGGDAPAPEAPEQEAGQSDTSFFISPEHLGQHLDPESVQPGDVLEFRVIGKDADGDIEVEYNTGGPKQSGMDKMKGDLAEHMAGSEAEPEPGSNY